MTFRTIGSLRRLVSVTLSLTVGYSACATGLNLFIAGATSHIAQLLRHPVQHPKQAPYLGKNPSRDEQRSRIWTAQAREDFRNSRFARPQSINELMASTSFCGFQGPGGGGYGCGNMPGKAI